jgi:hypothetical protein
MRISWKNLQTVILTALLLGGCVSAPGLGVETQNLASPLTQATITADETVSGTGVETQDLASLQKTGTSVPMLATRIASSATPSGTPAPTATLAPDFWMDLPVVPTVSERAKEIYRRGQLLGLNPAAFSKVGDCEATSTWFLGVFDGPPNGYDLAEYTRLGSTIDAFAGSWKRDSLAVRAGFTATSVMTALWADPKQCHSGETPLACEYRLHQPAFALIMLGSNNAARPERFEPQLRALLDQTIAAGIVPILSTKADNLEGDHSINAAVARLALEYDIPLWNFWAAVQPLPRHGLAEDGAHLTLGAPDFDDQYAMKTAWTVRNLTALQVIEAVWQGVREE